MIAVCTVGCLTIGVLVGYLLGRVAGGAMNTPEEKTDKKEEQGE